MPKIVDHDARREEIVDAVVGVVHRAGFAEVSVRSVALEAGWSAGATRHYFTSRQELLGFAMRTLAGRAAQRLERHRESAVDVEGVARLLEEVLPLDAARRAESEVWMALAVAARTDPSLQAVWRAVHSRLRGLMESCVLMLAQISSGDLDIPTETARLHALTDGLALHGTLEPRLPSTKMRGVLRRHLAELARES